MPMVSCIQLIFDQDPRAIKCILAEDVRAETSNVYPLVLPIPIQCPGLYLRALDFPL